MIDPCDRDSCGWATVSQPLKQTPPLIGLTLGFFCLPVSLSGIHNTVQTSRCSGAATCRLRRSENTFHLPPLFSTRERKLTIERKKKKRQGKLWSSRTNPTANSRGMSPPYLCLPPLYVSPLFMLGPGGSLKGFSSWHSEHKSIARPVCLFC